MAAATAGCMAGNDPAKIWQLPDTTGLKHEVVMLGGRSAFDSAIRLVGAKLVVAHTHDELRAALNESTAMVYTTWRDDRVQQALAITRPLGVPLMVDDAAGIPPIENLSRFAKLGVDLFCFRGKRAVRASVFRSLAVPRGPDRSGTRQLQSVGWCRVPGHEGGK